MTEGGLESGCRSGVIKLWDRHDPRNGIFPAGKSLEISGQEFVVGFEVELVGCKLGLRHERFT